MDTPGGAIGGEGGTRTTRIRTDEMTRTRWNDGIGGMEAGCREDEKKAGGKDQPAGWQWSPEPGVSGQGASGVFLVWYRTPYCARVLEVLEVLPCPSTVPSRYSGNFNNRGSTPWPTVSPESHYQRPLNLNPPPPPPPPPSQSQSQSSRMPAPTHRDPCAPSAPLPTPPLLGYSPLTGVLHWTTTAILRPETRQVASLRSRLEPIKLPVPSDARNPFARRHHGRLSQSGRKYLREGRPSRSWDLDPALIATPRARSSPWPFRVRGVNPSRHMGANYGG
ncbi:hypothetical protein BO78DRAFT_151748 [Aspergillus sclerotiicarbonarius CBS 121057]|uniref:Uncharacterized protein n=1 Tax=Aspergillus sclerotiicarbonarius (strain CBS 121057 / IBT 28362) TaxID=1448318 RepID=A0A319EUT9_ASPSB|nr:hypothetical protein BO78DRAFT_151748 [Aspergillus sclerotiicarbonarius CBS 121057]